MIYIFLIMYLSKIEGMKIKMLICIEEFVDFLRMNYKVFCWLFVECVCKCICKILFLVIVYLFFDFKYFVLYFCMFC